jgi:hypothetical protein
MILTFRCSEIRAIRRLQNARITAHGDLYHILAKLPRNCSGVPDNYPLNSNAFIELCRDRATVDRLLQAYELPIPDTDREAFVDLAAFLGINQRLVPGTRVRVRGRDAPNVPI